MSDALANLALNKKLCTGVALTYGRPPNLDPLCTNEEEFIALVTDYYVLFREALRVDVGFLRSVEDTAAVRSFDKLIYELRTAKQHHDNQQAAAAYERWTSEYHPWARAAKKLASLLADALRQLEQLSARVRRDQQLSRAWLEKASLQPEAVFESVCQDLCVRFSTGNRRRLIRNVTARLQRLRPGDDVRSAAEEYAVQEITSQNRALPLPYFEVLDRLGLIGKKESRAALLLAYSITDSTNLAGEDFLSRVEEVWETATR